MKREGWQHGLVRSAKATAVVDCATGKAAVRPTNHSRFTGKCRKARCGVCHSHPVSKSRDKAKGTYKLKSCDVALNHRLVSWRVADGRGLHWSKYSGVSASGILDRLSVDDHRDHDDDDDVVEMADECSIHEGDEDIEEAAEFEDDDDDMGFFEVGFNCEYLDGEDWCLVHEM